MNTEKVWFCQECQTMMEHQEAGFDKCPVCGAEAWPDGEAQYEPSTAKAALAEKVHGVWYCQKCRVPMIPIDENYCKCPECTAEVWYGKPKHETREELRGLMEEAEGFPHLPHNCNAGILYGGKAARAGGGGSHGKNNRKANMNKPTTTQLYRRLCDG